MGQKSMSLWWQQWDPIGNLCSVRGSEPHAIYQLDDIVNYVCERVFPQFFFLKKNIEISMILNASQQ